MHSRSAILVPALVYGALAFVATRFLLVMMKSSKFMLTDLQEIGIATAAFVAVTALAAAALLHEASVRDRDPRLCARCGYDCRATPDRCPECGTVPAGADAERGGAGTPRCGEDEG